MVMLWMLVKFSLYLLLIMEGARGELSKTTQEEEILKTLMQNYDKNARPASKTTISITSLTIINFEMHEYDHSIDLHTWFAYDWIDPRLKYNNDDHPAISHLNMDPDALWKPDLTVYNAVSGSKTLLKSQLPMLLYPTGKVLFVPVYHLHFSCIMDLTYWPHDTHNCSVKIGSWTHSGNLMDIIINDFVIKLEIPSTDVGNGKNMSRTEWDISETKAIREVKYYPCCEEPYIDILISLIITRNAPAFAWTVKMPAACLSILSLVLFLLPPGAGEKIIFGGLCLLLDLLVINYTSSAINHAPSHTPLIIQLVCQQIVLVMVSLIVSAIVVRLARDPHSTGLPSILKGPVTGIAYILCLGNYANLASGSYSSFARTLKSDEVELGDECSGDLRKREQMDNSEWLMLGAVVDRLSFILYLAICIISLIRFSSVL